MPIRAPADAPRDALTGLMSLTAARKRLGDWLETRPRPPVLAMLLSVGRIDRVNVAYGENTGDGALIEIAQRIRHLETEELPANTTMMARSSGNSFLLLTRADMPEERFTWLAEQLADRVAAPIADPASEYFVRLFPRITLLRVGPEDTADSILDILAEAAVRLEDRAGQRIGWASGDPVTEGRSHHQLEHDLLGALDRDEIEVFFQPQYRVADDALIGAEALARWYHPVLGRIGAGTLFAIAERAEHIAPLSRHIARKALLAAREWPAGLKLSINVTPADLAPGSFAADFAALMDEMAMAPEDLTLEITEQVLLADLDRVSEMLEGLRERGVSLSLDDFGAGYCNFRYLKMLPIDTIKLDKAMIVDVLEDPRDLAVFRAIVAMARALDLQVLVEGIEQEEQRRLLTREGCDFYQGFLKAEPMPGSAFLKLALDQA